MDSSYCSVQLPFNSQVRKSTKQQKTTKHLLDFSWIIQFSVTILTSKLSRCVKPCKQPVRDMVRRANFYLFHALSRQASHLHMSTWLFSPTVLTQAGDETSHTRTLSPLPTHLSVSPPPLNPLQLLWKRRRCRPGCPASLRLHSGCSCCRGGRCCHSHSHGDSNCGGNTREAEPGAELWTGKCLLGDAGL